MSKPYEEAQPSRAEVDAMPGAVLLDFGTNWCGWCRGAAPLVSKALADRPEVRHIKAEDGPGRKLGRSFGVKLWPTLVALRDGQEIGRVTRPQAESDVSGLLAQISPPA